MKKIIVSIIVILTLISLCGCSSSDEDIHKNQVYTETQGDLLITYIYDYDDVISKSVYNNSTGRTTTYAYYYNDNAWGKSFVGMSTITIGQDGEIIDKFDSK